MPCREGALSASRRITTGRVCSGDSGHSVNTAKEIKHFPSGFPALGQGLLPYVGSFALLVSLRSDTINQLQPTQHDFTLVSFLLSKADHNGLCDEVIGTSGTS